jgi:para-nitrobenzyl esterase
MVIISTIKGKIEGIQELNYQYFLGIPYAKPPIGDLRFREPHPVDSWVGVKETTRFGSIAPQGNPDNPPIKQKEDEDCLYLNIWTPSADEKARPVMVWIHGGGFVIGASSRPRLNGARLSTHGDVVVVSFNYRLGALGFLNLPGIPPNIGILDQISALKWIRENIKVFGGDANNITIFGESAGGMSAAILLTIPTARNLFHKVIIESGAANPKFFEATQARKGGEEFLSKLRIEKDNIDVLREVPLKKIMRVQKKIAGTLLDEKENPFRPFVDEIIIPEQPLEIIRKGNASKVPLIIGYNKDELGMISDLINKADEKRKEVIIGLIKALINKSGISESNVDRIMGVYKREMEKKYPNNPYKHLDAFLSDSMFRIPIIRQLEAHIIHQSNVYCYMFAYDPPKYGYTLHTFEIPFVLGNLDSEDMMEGAIESNQETEALAKTMMDTWVTFARTGNPNHDGLPQWPPYDMNQRSTMMRLWIIFVRYGTVFYNSNFFF